MKKCFAKASILLAFLLSSCSFYSNKSKSPIIDDKEIVSLETQAKLEEALDSIDINYAFDNSAVPLEIEETEYDGFTKSIYEFDEGDANQTIVILNDEDVVPSASDLRITDEEKEITSITTSTLSAGRGEYVIPIHDSFDEGHTYYVEIMNDRFYFEGKDNNIRKLTYVHIGDVSHPQRARQIKDSIIELDINKVDYYDTDGYSPFFIYSEDVSSLFTGSEKTFKVDDPDAIQDSRDTLYGEFKGCYKNPNGAGYMVRYSASDAMDAYSELNILDYKRIDENDDIRCLINDEFEKEPSALVQTLFTHNESVLKTMYGLYNYLGVKPRDYKASLISWASRLDIKISTNYDSSKDTFTFNPYITLDFTPKEHLNIRLKLDYKQTTRYDVSASVSLRTKWKIIPVGINYKIKVVEDCTKEVEFGVIISYDHRPAYDEDEVKASINQAIADSMMSDFQKKSWFNGDDPQATKDGATTPIFSISCSYFFPLEIKFDISFYWAIAPSFEAFFKYSSHTQKVHVDVSNSSGSSPSSDDQTSSTSNINLRFVGKLHAEVGVQVTLGVGIVGFYKFFHAEVYLKGYGYLDASGYLMVDIGWQDDHHTESNVSIGGKFEIGVGAKVGVDIYLLFGGYNHEWPIVNVPLIGFANTKAVASFVDSTAEIGVTNGQIASSYSPKIDDFHILGTYVLNGDTFNLDSTDMKWDDSYETRYGAFLNKKKERYFLSGTVSDSQYMTFDNSTGAITFKQALIDDKGEDPYDMTLTITVNPAMGHASGDITKVITVRYEGTDTQVVKVDSVSIGTYLVGRTIKLPIPETRKHYEFTGWKNKNDEAVLPNASVEVKKNDDKMDFTSQWTYVKRWQVYFMDMNNRVISLQSIKDGEKPVYPTNVEMLQYMSAPSGFRYAFIEFTVNDLYINTSSYTITGPTVIRGRYRLLADY